LPRLFLSLLILTLHLQGCILERPGIYGAKVSERDGLPCFAVDNTRDTRNYPPVLRAIQVSTSNEGQEQILWAENYYRNETPPRLPPDQCMSYSDQAPALSSHRVYSVQINSHLPKKDGPDVRTYQAYFCLLPATEGKQSIRQIEWNEFDVCEKK